MINTIQTTEDLNRFVVAMGGVSPDKIISKLAERKVIISSQMAKLILLRSSNFPV